jgi:hypothetical protein
LLRLFVRRKIERDADAVGELRNCGRLVGCVRFAVALRAKNERPDEAPASQHRIGELSIQRCVSKMKIEDFVRRAQRNERSVVFIEATVVPVAVVQRKLHG